jgi:hypothetical protein
VVNAETRISVLLLVLLLAPGAWAEIGVTARIRGNTSLVHEEESEFSLLSYGESRLDLKSYGNNNVRGQLQLDTLISEEIELDVPRAFIRVRFPAFRLTLGKTRVSWGEGFLFNAGDVVFEGISLLDNLTELELRDETDWMLVPYLPLGTFSFIEGLILPHPRLEEGGDGIPVSVPLSRVDVGSRIHTKAAGIKLEGGYLYKGSEERHRPYVSFQGGLLTLDWHLSTSLAIPTEDADRESLRRGWDISVGFFRIVNLPSSGSITFRFESGLTPFAHWEEASSSTPPDYGIYLYPEVSVAVTDSLSYFVRSIVSPIDGSALSFAGIRWNIFQGFTMSFYFSMMLGDKNDLFGWNRPGDTTLTSEMEYIYGGKL